MSIITENLKNLKKFIIKSNKNKTNKVKMVWNDDLKKFIKDDSLLKKVKLIIIGENPGNSELKHKKYFYEFGRSGKILRALLSSCDNNYDEKVMFFNKTPIYSSNIKKLKELRINNENLFDSAELICAETISNIVTELKKTNDLNILFIGLSDGKFKFNKIKNMFEYNYDPNKELFSVFFNSFFKITDIEFNIIPHLSNGSFFTHDFILNFYKINAVNKQLFKYIFNSKILK